MDGPPDTDLVTSILQSLDINSIDSGVGEEPRTIEKAQIVSDGSLIQTAKKASTWNNLETGKTHAPKGVTLAPQFPRQSVVNAPSGLTKTRPRRQYGFVSTTVQGGTNIPYEYEKHVPKPVQKMDFRGNILPQRSPDEEFQNPTRFAEKSRIQYGSEIKHESHRFLYTKQLWPNENRDYEFEKYREKITVGTSNNVNRIYDDPYQPDLVFKVQDKRQWNTVVSSEYDRSTRVLRSSRRRKSLQGKFPLKI